MLTKQDLEQIRKILREETKEIVREEIGNETQSLKEELQADITMSRIRVQSDIGDLKTRIKSLEIRMTKMHKELKEEIKLVANFLDKENVKTVKRVEKIEQRIGTSYS
jgi:hypothetical protein